MFNDSFFFIYHVICVLYISFAGIFLSRRNIIVLLIAIEIMLTSINMLFIFYAMILDDLTCEMLSLFILTVSAAESAIGLSLVIVYYKNYNLFITA